MLHCVGEIDDLPAQKQREPDAACDAKLENADGSRNSLSGKIVSNHGKCRRGKSRFSCPDPDAREEQRHIALGKTAECGEYAPDRNPDGNDVSTVIAISGEAMRIAAAQKLADNRISNRSMAQSLRTRNLVSRIASTMNSSAAASMISAR